MKALIYKELKLAMHPICYVFIFLFPFMVLIPNYPICIGFIYVLICYPILFLGAYKGQQSNDLLFTTLMPVRKKDIVAARLFTVSLLQVVTIIISACLVPLAQFIKNSINESAIAASEKPPITPGLSLNGFVSIIGLVLISYAISDLIFFSIYYKKGKSIVMSSLLSIITFSILLSVLTIIIPLISKPYLDFLCNTGLGFQFIVLAGGIILYLLFRLLTYKISSKKLEKVDF